MKSNYIFTEFHSFGSVREKVVNLKDYVKKYVIIDSDWDEDIIFHGYTTSTISLVKKNSISIFNASCKEKVYPKYTVKEPLCMKLEMKRVRSIFK